MIAQRVDAVFFREDHRIDDVAEGLAHLAALNENPAVTVYLLRKRQIQRHQEDGPVDRMEADNVFPDQVNVRGPVAVHQIFLVVQIAQSRDVVRQRVHPDVDDVIRIEADRYTPVEGASRDAQILKTWSQEVVEHFILARFRLDKIRMSFDIVDEPVRVLAHSEEVRFLGSRLHLAAAVGTFAVDELRVCPEGFAGRTVVAFVLALVNIPLIVQLLEDTLDRLDVLRIGGADKLIVVDVHQLPQRLDLLDLSVHIFLRRNPRGFRDLLDLLTVLVRARQQICVVACQRLEALHRIGRYRRVGVSDMEISARIVDRCRNIIGWFSHISLLDAQCAH